MSSLVHGPHGVALAGRAAWWDQVRNQEHRASGEDGGPTSGGQVTAAALVVERIAPADWLAACRCHACGTVDSDGTRGPESSVRPQPLERDVCIARHSERWYCLSCSAAVWAAHVTQALALSRRLERLERWKRHELCWQVARVWIQLELPW